MLARWAALPGQMRIPLTPDMTETLNAEMVRTGVGPVTLLRNAKDRPADLTWGIIQCWSGGTVETVNANQWDYLIDHLRSLPNASAPSRSHFVRRQGRDKIAASDLAELKAHRDRTGFGGGVILRNATDIPPGLTPAMISNWLSGNAKTADPEHVAYLPSPVSG